MLEVQAKVHTTVTNGDSVKCGKDVDMAVHSDYIQ